MKKIYLLIWGSLLFFASCKKELPKPSTSNLNALSSNKASLASYPGLTVQDGRLTFTDLQSFNNLMNRAFADSSLDEIRGNIAGSFGGSSFVSYASRGSAGTVINGSTPPPSRPQPFAADLEQDTLIEDTYFAEVLNVNAEIQVENVIYKVTPNGTFAVAPDHINQLNSMLDANGMLSPTAQNSMTFLDEGLYRIDDFISFFDTYGLIRRKIQMISYRGAQPNGGRPPCMNCGVPPPPSPINTAPFGNVNSYPFNSKYTAAGKLLQDVFGDPHYKYFSGSAFRLKVNFYSRNWLIFASVGVRAVIQKKTTFIGLNIWDPVSNKDEMRLGWTPIVMKLDLPAFTMPNTTAPQDPFTVAGKISKNAVKLVLGDSEFLGLKVEDVLDANYAFPFLTGDEINKLNSFTLFDVNAFIKNQSSNEIDNLIKKVKTKLNYTAPTNKIAFIKDVQTIVEGDVMVHNSNQGNGVMSKTFNFNTAIVGFTFGANSTYIFKPAKTIEVVKGSVYALGKMNGEWIGMAVTKQ